MTAYITVLEVKKALQLAPDDNDDDDALQLSIDTAEGMIDEHCHRRFDQVDEVRFYSVVGSSVVLDDVAELTEVALDEDGDRVYERVLGVNEYWPLPLNCLAKGRPIEALDDLPVTTSATGAVRVSATFGWPDVPVQVRQAALSVALRLFGFRGPFGTAGSPEIGSQAQAQAWKAAGVEGQLAPFVRHRAPVVA